MNNLPGYFIQFSFLENVVLLVFASHLSFEFIKLNIKASFGFCQEINVLKIQQLTETSQKNCRGRVFLKELQAARNFSRVSLHFNKIPNSLRQVWQTYSEICIFCVLQQKLLQKQLAKIDLKVPGKSCDEIDDDVMKFILQ